MKEERKAITLTPEELDLSKFILADERRVELIKKLSKGDMYFNQLAEKGSRSAIADTLNDLVQRGVLSYKWEVNENPDSNPAPFRAVKMFHLENKYREIIQKLQL